VKVELDEHLPVSAASIFAEAGHDVDTFEDEGLVGCDDPTVAGDFVSEADRLVRRCTVGDRTSRQDRGGSRVDRRHLRSVKSDVGSPCWSGASGAVKEREPADLDPVVAHHDNSTF